MLRLAQNSFLLLIFSLPFMNPALPLAGMRVTATDLLFVVTALLWAAALAAGATRFQWHTGFWLLVAYFAGLLVSAVFSTEPNRSLIKLATQAYLLLLPVFAYNLVDSEAMIERVFRTWLGATALVVALGALALLLFALGVDRSALEYPLHHFGTLPPGNYPRLDLTFTHPAMLCNYLTVSLIILLILRSDGLGRPVRFVMLFAILLSAAFTITPGLGGIPLALGLWYWLRMRERARTAAWASLGAAVAAAILFVLSAAVTPVVHPTAPFLIHVPGLDQPIAPAARLLFWIDAAERFLQRPIVGTGIGTAAVDVPFINPSGQFGRWSDAHNVYLSIAAQAGLLGLAALLTLIGWVARTIRPFHLGDGRGDAVRVGLGLAWLNAFAYQGLTGSYEDARHLWVLFGLFLAGLAMARDPAGRLRSRARFSTERAAEGV